MKNLPPNFIPPWQDIETLAAHLSISPPTVQAWVQSGIIPPPRERAGKKLWRWSEVDAAIAEGKTGAVTDARGAYNAVLRERAADRRQGH